jgi:hypothetical protein
MAARLTYGRRATIRDAARDMMIDRVTPAVGCGRSVSLGRPRSPSEVVGGGDPLRPAGVLHPQILIQLEQRPPLLHLPHSRTCHKGAPGQVRVSQIGVREIGREPF